MMVIARDRCCIQCGSRLFLEVHHTTYYVNGVSIVGKEKEYLQYLQLLCAEHHKLADLKLNSKIKVLQ